MFQEPNLLVRLFDSSRKQSSLLAVGPQNTKSYKLICRILYFFVVFFAWPLNTAAPCKNIVVNTLLIFAGPRGIEPRPTDLEAVVLPLNYRPKGYVHHPRAGISLLAPRHPETSLQSLPPILRMN